MQQPSRIEGRISPNPAGSREVASNTTLIASAASPADVSISRLNPPLSSRPITLSGTPKRTSGVANRPDNAG